MAQRINAFVEVSRITCPTGQSLARLAVKRLLEWEEAAGDKLPESACPLSHSCAGRTSGLSLAYLYLKPLDQPGVCSKSRVSQVIQGGQSIEQTHFVCNVYQVQRSHCQQSSGLRDCPAFSLVQQNDGDLPFERKTDGFRLPLTERDGMVHFPHTDQFRPFWTRLTPARHRIRCLRVSELRKNSLGNQHLS